MARFEQRRWEPQQDLTGLPRRDRKSCDYNVYIPDSLAERDFVFYADVAADIADAERSIVRLNARATALANTEALARLLLRAESVASSRIEGLEIGPRRLLRADAAEQLGEKSTDVTAAEVLANIDAMTFALDAMDDSSEISVPLLLEMHQRLLAPTRMAQFGGTIRRTQNWIGGSDYNPCIADFVPPPPELVEPLLIDLCAFCNDDSLPTIAQAAIAHAQFETIHPFVDGNGRVGRTLIHLVLRTRGLTTAVTPPISLVLATLAKDYVEGLTRTRYPGASDSPDALDGLNRWIATFAAACSRAVKDAEAFEDRILDMQDVWRQKLGSVRSGSAVELLIQKLPGAPIVTVSSAARLMNRSVQAANEAISRLVEKGILSPLTAGGQRRRVFEAPEVMATFTDLERQLASPAGSTNIAPPTRPVPYPPTHT